MNSNLIEYLKHNYPYIITNGDLFYIIENNKIIAFSNGKEVIKLSDKKHITLPKNIKITNIPILKNIYNLNFTYLSKGEENTLIKDIKKTLKTSHNYNYDAFYNSDNNTFIYIKKEYQKYINDIIQNMQNDQVLIEICKKEIMYNMDYILKRINDYKNDVSHLFLHLIDPNMKITKKFYQQNKNNCNFLLKHLELLEKNEKNEQNDNSENSSLPSSLSTASVKVPSSLSTALVKPNLLLDNITILKHEIKKLKELYNKDNLYIILQNSYKKRCKKYILHNKDDIIYSIKDYYNKWVNWCDSEKCLNKNDIYLYKKEIIKNSRILQDILKNMISSESNINKSIVSVDSMLKHLLNEQLIYLSLKDNFNKNVIDNNSTFTDTVDRRGGTTESNFFDDSEKNIKYRLKKIRELLYLNNNTPINNTDIDNKSELVFHFIIFNNIFFRKQRVITELNDIIQNENLVIKDYILNEFYKIKNEFDKHIYFLNLQEIINSPFLQYHKTNSFIERIPETFYNNITNIIYFLNFNILYYRNQDLNILNIIDDLIDDVNIYIRIKPLVGINDKTLLIPTKLTENSIILNNKTYNEFENVFPDYFTNLDVYIGKQDFENRYLLEDVNFLEKLNVVPNGLYNAFNKLQMGYSLFLYGKGISCAGTSYTFFGENDTPGIVQYGLANLKNVSNIKLKYLFEQYVSNANDKNIKGNIHNLINIVPELDTYFSIDETTQFSEIIPSYIDTKSLDIKDLQDLCKTIDSHRTKMNRIKELPFGKSSRSSLYYIFQIESINDDDKPFKTYLTVVDSCSQDSPNDIYNTFIKDMYLENLMICDKDEAITFIQNHAKNSIKNDYSPEFIYKCIQESIYNNEALNHFNYYINSKNNYYDNIKYHNFDERDFNKLMYFVNPKSEFHEINRNNNCLTIPIMKFIENISLKKDIIKIKYHLIYNIRTELSSLSQTMHTLYLTQDINDKKLYGSIQKLEKHSDYLNEENHSDYPDEEKYSDLENKSHEENVQNKTHSISQDIDKVYSIGEGKIKIIIEKDI